MTPSFSHLVTRFFTCFLAAERGLSANTVASYADTMRLLIDYLCGRLKVEPEQLTASAVSRDLILDFLDHLQTDRHNGVATRNQRLAALKTFLRFLARTVPELMHLNEEVHAVRAKKTEHAPPPSLTVEEVHAVIAAPDLSTLIGTRDKALLQLLYNTGARVQEIADLTLSDLRLELPASVTLTGKGKKRRVVPIWPETVAIIRDYLRLREHLDVNSEHLFLGKRNEPMTRSGIGRRVGIYAAVAAEHLPSLNDKNVTPHAFRHTVALHLLEAGNDVVVVKDWLGHADLATTCKYLSISLDRKREALEKLPPPPATTGKEVPRKWKKASIMDFLAKLSATGGYVAKASPEPASNSLKTTRFAT